MLIVGLPLLGVLVVARLVFAFITQGTRPVVREAARRLGGRIDPASEDPRCPAVLVELNNRLIRVVGWPLRERPYLDEHPPYIEIYSPIDVDIRPILVVRRNVANTLLGILYPDGPVPSAKEGDELCDSYFGPLPAHASAWFEQNPSWVLLEIDGRLVRILTDDPQREFFGSHSIEGSVRAFGECVPEILRSAGPADSSSQRRRH